MTQYCILQLSDIHIGLEGEDTYSIDVRAHFLDCLSDGIQRGAQLIVISGDIAFHAPDPKIYEWVYKQLQKTNIPWFVLPGNHDSSKQLAHHFSQKEWYKPEQNEMYSSIIWNRRQLIFLDSAKGDLSTPQLDWLSEQLSIQKDSTPLIFLHHPPTPIQMMHMENPYHGPSPKLLHQIETQRPHSHIFVGHYHINRVVSRPKSTIYTCPSTYFQIDPTTKNFKSESQQPGYSLIHFDEHTLMRTTHYLPAKLLPNQTSIA